MSRNYKKKSLKFIALLALSVVMTSPAKAAPPEEMTLDFSLRTILHRDVTHIKFECSLEGSILENGEWVSEGEVATGTATAPKPLPGDGSVISVHFEPTVDDFELERSADYVCQMYVQNEEDEEQGWVAVSNARSTPDIAYVTDGASILSALDGGRPINFRGSLIGRD